MTDPAEPTPEPNVTAGTPKTSEKTPRPIGLQLAGAGMELAATTIILGAIGGSLDNHFANESAVLTVLLGLVGFLIGIFRFIRLAIRASAEAEQSDARARAAQPKDPLSEIDGGEETEVKKPFDEDRETR